MMTDREAFFRAHAAHRAAVLQMEALQIATRGITFEIPGSREPANLTDSALKQVYEMMDHCLESVRQAIGLEPPPVVYVDKEGNLSMQIHPKSPEELEAGDG